MKKVIVVGKVWNYEVKKTTTGKNYIDICIIESVKNTDDTWSNEFTHTKCWQSSKNYDDTLRVLKSIKTVSAAKKEADKVEMVCGFELGSNFKTKEPEIQYSFRSISKVIEDTTPSVSQKTMYEAPATQEATSQDDEPELPF